MKKSEALADVKVRLISDRSQRGVIIVPSSRKNKKDVIVEWQNGGCYAIDPSELEVVPPSDAKLERDFEKLAVSVGEKIQDKLKQSELLLLEACDLADQYGLPFFSKITLLGQPYVPENFESKWGDLDRDFVANITEVMSPDLDSSCGWSHSQIC